MANCQNNDPPKSQNVGGFGLVNDMNEIQRNASSKKSDLSIESA